MKKIPSFLAILFLVCLFLAGNAMALNTRPVTLGSSGEGTLQGIFDSITQSGPGIDAYNDQINAAYFNSSSSGGSVATFIIEIAGNADSNSFGIFDSADPTNRAQIFNGAATGGSQALVSFMANGDIQVNFVTVASGFDASFGFYLGTPNTYFYTDDSLNPGGNPQALIYQGDDLTTIRSNAVFDPGLFTHNEYILAWEDLPFAGADKDFNDMVVMMESITPVPEPATMLLFGLGVLGLGAFGRKKLMK